MDLFLHENPVGRHTNLPLMGESAEGRRIDRILQIGILKNDQGAVAAKLKQRFFKMFYRQLSDMAADLINR